MHLALQQFLCHVRGHQFVLWSRPIYLRLIIVRKLRYRILLFFPTRIRNRIHTTSLRCIVVWRAILLAIDMRHWHGQIGAYVILTRHCRHLLNRLIRSKLMDSGICSRIRIISLEVATFINERSSARGVVVCVPCLMRPWVCAHIAREECLRIGRAWRYCSWIRNFHFILLSELVRTYLSSINFRRAYELLMCHEVLLGRVIHQHWGLATGDNGLLLLTEEVGLSLSSDDAIVSRTIVGSTWLTLSSHSVQGD